MSQAAPSNKRVNNYSILANKSLKEISVGVPTTIAELKQIHGIGKHAARCRSDLQWCTLTPWGWWCTHSGDHKATKYGQRILDAVRGFVRDKGIRLRGAFSAVKKPSTPTSSPASDTGRSTGSGGGNDSGSSSIGAGQSATASSAHQRPRDGNGRPRGATSSAGPQGVVNNRSIYGGSASRAGGTGDVGGSGITQLCVGGSPDQPGCVDLVNSQPSRRGPTTKRPLDGDDDDDFDFDVTPSRPNKRQRQALRTVTANRARTTPLKKVFPRPSGRGRSAAMDKFAYSGSG